LEVCRKKKWEVDVPESRAVHVQPIDVNEGQPSGVFCKPEMLLPLSGSISSKALGLAGNLNLRDLWIAETRWRLVFGRARVLEAGGRLGFFTTLVLRSDSWSEIDRVDQSGV
jgi:hypothetical protein